MHDKKEDWKESLMEQQFVAAAIADKIKKKYPKVVKRNEGKVPYTAVNGRFDDQTEQNICWWTNGFYGGILWQLYHADNRKEYREAAEALENKLDAVLMNYEGMDHDSGFRFLLTAVADYRMTGMEEARNRGLLAAANLAGRFNPKGNYIRAWNDNGQGKNIGWAIIDCMMNLPLLYWATEITKDPRFKHIAVLHADTVLKNFVREDGSVRHIVEFDAESGEFVQDFGGQGYGKGSSWTRGQAWALYGFTLSYLHTCERRYLEAARKISAYFISHISDNGLIPIDFDQPEECKWEDSTAGAIAASGFLLLAEMLSGKETLAGGYMNPFGGVKSGEEVGSDIKEAERIKNAAIKLLVALDEKRCSWDADIDELLEKCTAAFHDEQHEFPIIYGDYYFIEAVFRLTGEEIFLW